MAPHQHIPPVTAVVVTYQSARTLPHALASLRRCHDEGLLDAIFVDNDSQDETLAILGREAPWARVIATGVNNGFGRGCNIGAAEAESPYILFFNPDATLEPDALRILLEFMDTHPKVGLCGPAIILGEDRVDQPDLQRTGPRATPTSIVLNALPFVKTRPMRPIEPGSRPFQTEWVSGALLLIRTDLLRSLCGFDPRFFLYWEEIDLCQRAEAAGHEIWAVGTAVAHHVGGASVPASDLMISHCIARHYLQSRYYYMIKHHGWMVATLTELAEATLVAARTLVDLVQGRGIGRMVRRGQARLLSLPKPPPPGAGTLMANRLQNQTGEAP